MARTSTFFPFSLLELAKARVLTYQLDTTDHLNPGLSIHKDLEALRMLEGTYVVTSLNKEVMKRDKTELTREELLASSEMQPSHESIRMGQILKVRVAQLGGKEATWILESSDGHQIHLRIKVCGRDWTMGEIRVTSGIEGRDMVCKIWEFEGSWGKAAEQKM